MIYMGSKARIAKELLEIMLKDIGDRYFVDCFCGGGNLIQFADCKNKIASDINPYTIAFLKRIQTEGCEWLPKNNQEFTKEHYLYVKNNKDKFLPSVLGHIGYNLSFGGSWFHGFRSDNTGKRDYVAEAYRGAIKQSKMLNGTKFNCCSYSDLIIPKDSIIYCDIPYGNTHKYDLAKSFNYEQFYDWCRKMNKIGHTIYVSEYQMPEDFKIVWQKNIKVQIDKNSNSKEATEKLFTLERE